VTDRQSGKYFDSILRTGSEVYPNAEFGTFLSVVPPEVNKGMIIQGELAVSRPPLR
jgi:hypothetical protein